MSQETHSKEFLAELHKEGLTHLVRFSLFNGDTRKVVDVQFYRESAAHKSAKRVIRQSNAPNLATVYEINPDGSKSYVRMYWK